MKVIVNTPNLVTFEKENDEHWGNCSNDSLRERCNRTEAITRVQWRDGDGIGTIAKYLDIYF